MKEKIFALTTALTLLLTSGIVAAFDFGPDGTIDTYFYADGAMPYYHTSLALNPEYDGDEITGFDDYVNEKVWTLAGEVMVIENIDLEDHSGWFGSGYADANVDKLIYVTPGSLFFIEFDANVEKTAVWDGVGEVYREAWLGDDIYSSVHAGTLYGEGSFMDSIVYQDSVRVYESVGLNRGASCEMPVAPDPVPFPSCEWC